jgi:hypothetical protein
MPGDPKECRRYAARCAELAMTARNSQLKIKFLELSKIWEQLAIDLEDAFGGLVESERIRADARLSLDEAKRLSKLLDSLK